MDSRVRGNDESSSYNGASLSQRPHFSCYIDVKLLRFLTD